MVGINLSKNLRIGYSYDWKMLDAFNKNLNTYGSHEIILNYRIRVYEEQYGEQTPRFFD
jgi:hypothetical protein